METEGRIFVLTVTATPGRMAFLREVVNEEKLTVGILDGHDRYDVYQAVAASA